MNNPIKSIASGKTKKIVPYIIVQRATDDITAGDGAKHDVISEKAKWSTITTCNNFQFLRRRGIPVAFIKQLSDIEFIAQYCAMLPYEVVVRRQVAGKNFPARCPNLKVGHRFDVPEIEFFLKTNNSRWKERDLPCDDPLMVFRSHLAEIDLFIPNKPVKEENHILTMNFGDVFIYATAQELEFIEQIKDWAMKSFLLLEEGWGKLGFTLADIKFEFGVDYDGKLRLADVIDNESGRLMVNETHYSKELYRQDVTLDEVGRTFAMIARESEKLRSL